MTNSQLYLAIGVPILVNIAFNGLLILVLQTSLNRRIDDLRDLWRAELGRVERHFDERFVALEAMWRGELHRVEEVIDARLKSLEERRS